MTISQLTIYGAGLIGGSIAMLARQSGLYRKLVAIDLARPKDEASSAIFDEWALSADQQKRALAASELTVLCVPVRMIIHHLPRVLDATAGTVTDCGSTKAAICRSIADHPSRGRFVAGHPMAGHPDGGLANASADLFAGRRWILCPEGSSAQAMQVTERLVQATGAHVVHLDSVEHDASVAWTSHVPQVVASALSVYASRNEALQAAGPGFASATRVAGGAEAMWGDIFATNGAAIGNALLELGEALEALGRGLSAGDPQTTMDVLAEARALRSKSS